MVAIITTGKQIVHWIVSLVVFQNVDIKNAYSYISSLQLSLLMLDNLDGSKGHGYGYGSVCGFLLCWLNKVVWNGKRSWVELVAWVRPSIMEDQEIVFYLVRSYLVGIEEHVSVFVILV